jgi:chromate transport protein ChrA
MNTNIRTAKMNTKILLIILWVFYSVNFMYCDALTSLEPGVLSMTMSGYTGGGTVKITDGFVLGTAMMFEIPFLMIVLSWVLQYRANRWANIIAGILFVVVQIGSLFLGVPSPMYIFYSTVEIAALLLIVWNAWKWTNPEALVPADEVARASASAGASIPHLMSGRK